jgi:hypothetical protein
VCPIGRRFHADRQFASPHGPSWEGACSRSHWYIQRGYGACQSAFASKLPPTVDRVDRGIFGWLGIWRCGRSNLKSLLQGLRWRGFWSVPDKRPISCRSTILPAHTVHRGRELAREDIGTSKGDMDLAISLREQAPSHGRPVDGGISGGLGVWRCGRSTFNSLSQGLW